MDNYVDKIKLKLNLWTKMGKNRVKKERTKKTNLITNNQQVVLASLSKTRQIEIKKYFKILKPNLNNLLIWVINA